MSTPFWQGLTDEQLAEMMQLTARVERLNALLLAEQNKVAFLNAQLANEHEKYARADEDWRADFARQAGECTELADKFQRTENRLRVLAQHVPDFVADFLATYEPFTDDALTPEYRVRRQNARELMTLLEPFAT